MKNLNDLLPEAIDAVIFDFDGVFTNNKVYLSQDGIESVRCDRSDGWGIGKLQKLNIKLAVMSSEANPVVLKRCQKLDLECYNNLKSSKYDCLMDWCKKNTILPKNIIFIGNDENDIECLKVVGCGVVPADANTCTIPHAKIVLKHNGGDGAVREICDLISEVLS